jgi:pyruvate formate lyase activating enzyme
VTTLLIPGLNDSDGELHSLATFLVSVSPDIPWHVSRFYPTYRLLDVPPTPVETVEKAVRIGREAGLRYVYGGNVPGHSSESTACPGCGRILLERAGHRLSKNRAANGHCPDCGQEIPGLLKEV